MVPSLQRCFAMVTVVLYLAVAGCGKSEPPNPLQLADQKLFEKDFAAALTVCDEILSSSPRSVDAWIMRGRIQLAQRKFDQALVEFDRALEIDPKNYNAYSRRAFAHEALGNTQAALNDRLQARKFNPDFQIAYQNTFPTQVELENFDIKVAPVSPTEERRNSAENSDEEGASSQTSDQESADLAVERFGGTRREGQASDAVVPEDVASTPAGSEASSAGNSLFPTKRPPLGGIPNRVKPHSATSAVVGESKELVKKLSNHAGTLGPRRVRGPLELAVEEQRNTDDSEDSDQEGTEEESDDDEQKEKSPRLDSDEPIDDEPDPDDQPQPKVPLPPRRSFGFPMAEDQPRSTRIPYRPPSTGLTLRGEESEEGDDEEEIPRAPGGRFAPQRQFPAGSYEPWGGGLPGGYGVGGGRVGTGFHSNPPKSPSGGGVPGGFGTKSDHLSAGTRPSGLPPNGPMVQGFGLAAGSLPEGSPAPTGMLQGFEAARSRVGRGETASDRTRPAAIPKVELDIPKRYTPWSEGSAGGSNPISGRK